MNPDETLAYIREFADRKAFLHAAKVLRLVADRLEKKYKGKQESE